MYPSSAVEPTIPTLAEGLARAATGNLEMTLEALLPQFRALCRVFYQRHPQTAIPIAARRWLHRELISRFGVQSVLDVASHIDQRLSLAQRGVKLALTEERTDEN